MGWYEVGFSLSIVTPFCWIELIHSQVPGWFYARIYYWWQIVISDISKLHCLYMGHLSPAMMTLKETSRIFHRCYFKGKHPLEGSWLHPVTLWAWNVNWLLSSWLLGTTTIALMAFFLIFLLYSFIFLFLLCFFFPFLFSPSFLFPSRLSPLLSFSSLLTPFLYPIKLLLLWYILMFFSLKSCFVLFRNLI